MHPALAWGVAALLLSAALAGCTAPPSPDGLTAKEAQTRGQPRAQAWKLDARLAGLATVEAHEGSALVQGWMASGRGPPAGLTPPGPEALLDGRAGVWYLHYTSPTTNATLEVLVAANGTLSSVELQRGRGGQEEGDLTLWAVDSVAAFDAALGDGNFSAAARAPDGGVAFALGPRGGQGPHAADPFWILTAASAQAGTGAWVFVNARTGERLPVSLPFAGFNATTAPPPPGGRPPPQNLSFNGTLTAAEPRDEHPFQVALGHRDIVLDARWNATEPTDYVFPRVVNPFGNEVQPDDEQLGNTTYHAHYNVEGGSGNWIVRVDVVSDVEGLGPPTPGVQATYELTLQIS